MLVSELVELLKQMPQDLEVEIGLDMEGQTGDGLVVSLEKYRMSETKDSQYVFIGNY